jgi:methylenetetrahydrofolate reductase (NADPH)
MNQGILLHEETESLPTDFCIGVAAYPEKHFEAVSLEEDLRYLKQKVDAGADYIVTQMFFDNEKYFDFVRKCREIGILVPIIPGIKPLATLKQLEVLPEIFHLEIPEALASEVRKCDNNAAIKQIGVEWAIQQGKELIQANVPALHFYTMSKSDSVRAIASALF